VAAGQLHCLVGHAERRTVQAAATDGAKRRPSKRCNQGTTTQAGGACETELPAEFSALALRCSLPATVI
jgi:hypothetical protein